jgi:hypothetical protein
MAPRGPAPKTSRRGLLVGTVATIGVVIALVVALVGTTGTTGTTGSATSPDRVVLLSAQTALADKTADLGLSMTIQGPGGVAITATGSGTVDFAHDAGQLDVAYAGSTQMSGMELKELFIGDSFYLSIPGISQVVPGKTWVSESLAGANSVTPGSSNPAALLQLLAEEGGTVTSAGTTTIDGEGVRAYNVAVSASALAKRLAHAEVPASVAAEAETIFGSAGIHMTVYVTSATNLVRRIAFTMHLTVAGQTVGATVTEDLTDYGVPVSISAPSADQVMTLQQFEAAASSASLGSAGISSSSA